MRIFVVGDIHAQTDKFWHILQDAGLADRARQATDILQQTDNRLVLLGDLVHAKSRARYAALIGVSVFDEYNPAHIRQAEAVQETFLRDVQRFAESLPAGRVELLLGNHDHNAIHPDQGPLRSDDVSHLEWKETPLPDDLCAWLDSWKQELVIEDIHFAHVGPLPEHNRYDNGFYLENRRRWIYEDKDLLASTPYRLGVYGHTPVRGGVNIASQGRAILLDTNGHAGEYSYLVIDTDATHYQLTMKGLFFDERLQR